MSRASDEDTSWELNALLRGWAVQEAVLPAEWLPTLPLPYLVIIDDTNLAAVQREQIQTRAVTLASPIDDASWGRFSRETLVWNESVTTDGDTVAFDNNLYGVSHAGFPYAAIKLTTLPRATPPLPSWVLAGLFRRSGLFREGFVFQAPAVLVAGHVVAASDQLWLKAGTLKEAFGPGTIWSSPAETQRLLNAPLWTRIPLLPLAQLFAEDPPSAADLPRWESEAGLFLRWGLMGPGREDAASFKSFLHFVERARREPVNEALFVACFGYGYGAMEEEVGAFPQASPQPTDHRAGPEHSLPVPHPAGPSGHSGRIGQSPRRLAAPAGRRCQRAQNPPLSSGLLALSGRMLLGAYREDNALPPDQVTVDAVAALHIQDPKLLAVFGLYDHDAGRDAKARELLEPAVAAQVMRPRAYLALAEIRYAEAVAHPGAGGGRLSTAQAEAVLDPLRQALRFPPNPEVYTLLADTWLRSAAAPPASDLALLAAGTAIFPRSTVLAYKSAVVCDHAGDRPQAMRLIDRALGFAIEPSAHSRLQALRASLGTPVVAAQR